VVQVLGVYRKYVLELGKSIEDLSKIGLGKLAIAASIVDIDNISDTLSDMEGMTQQEVSDKVKESKGLAPNETREDNGDRRLTFKGPEEIVDTIKEAIELAKENLASTSSYYSTSKNVPDLQALELMAVNFITNADMFGNGSETLQTIVTKLEDLFDVGITVTSVSAAKPVEAGYSQDDEDDLDDDWEDKLSYPEEYETFEDAEYEDVEEADD